MSVRSRVEEAAERFLAAVASAPEAVPEPDGFEVGEMRQWRRQMRQALNLSDTTGPVAPRLMFPPRRNSAA